MWILLNIESSIENRIQFFEVKVYDTQLSRSFLKIKNYGLDRTTFEINLNWYLKLEAHTFEIFCNMFSIF